MAMIQASQREDSLEIMQISGTILLIIVLKLLNDYYTYRLFLTHTYVYLYKLNTEEKKLNVDQHELIFLTFIRFH